MISKGKDAVMMFIDPIIRTTPPKIQLFEDTDGKWRFRIRFKNGKIAATSEAYSSYDSAFDSAHSLGVGFGRFNISAPRFPTYVKEDKRFRKCAF